MLDAVQIQEIIPHRYPFFLVDRILEVEAGVKATGIKNVTMNEPFFSGTFSRVSRYAGSVDCGGLGSGWLRRHANGGVQSRKAWLFFAGIDNFRFRGQVVPGDTLTLEVEITRLKGSIGKGQATAKVGDKVVAEGELMFALKDRE